MRAAESSDDPIAADVLTDPSVLSAIEARGLALHDLIDAPAYESLTRVLEADLERVRRDDAAAGVGVARFSHRLFDARWLRSKSTRFELIGVVKRLDRALMAAGSCGETRLVYRLAYEAQKSGVVQSSRLPMTIGLEFRVPGPDCALAARRWIVPRSAASIAEHLRSEQGPLAPSLLKRDSDTLLVVVNVQQVRWPSTVRPALGGHAEYLLRAFRLDGEDQKLKPAPLENTPDVERLKANPAALAELKAFLRRPETLARIDQGSLLLPEKFAAASAVSVTPRGLARRANRPFSQLLSLRDFADINLAELVLVRSPNALIRRLDQLSCQGCHEARSIAGFHLLGEDRAGTPVENGLFTALSPHVISDLPRRQAIAAHALAGAPLDAAQPFAEHPEAAAGGYGAHCSLGTDQSFASWTCAQGLSCVHYDETTDGIGVCLPLVSGQAGDPCEVGSVTADANARRDGVRDVKSTACAGNAVCNSNAVGFPGGMCTEGCSEHSAGATCGAIAILDPFNACLARGQPFTACLRDNVRPAGLRSCDEARPCRDDYVCARVGTGGACIPPYFLFQLRVDGHP